MKRLFFGLLTALILAACSSDPVYYGMTPQQKEDYSKAIAGEYTGTYVILYNDGGGDDKAVKIKNSQMTITDQTMHSVCFHDYPVSQLSGVVADSVLAEALASAPNVDFQADYHFYDMQDNGDANWGFEPAAIPLTLHYGGADHHLVLKLTFCRKPVWMRASRLPIKVSSSLLSKASTKATPCYKPSTTGRTTRQSI